MTMTMTMTMLESSERFHWGDYLRAMRERYPELIMGPALERLDESLHIGIIQTWVHNEALVGSDPPDRFEPLAARKPGAARDVWTSSFDFSPAGMRRVAASCSYKGLIHLKPPSDLVLYANLMWELRPKTIIEFGALQGGSALWLADQLHAVDGSQVHSFELLDGCIHPSAAHPSLEFHRADLRDLATLDRSLFERLPHPWLVIDDAHENLRALIPFVCGFLEDGDYYVLEDVLAGASRERLDAVGRLCDGLMVDSRYTDAFGYNVTCAPNGWLRKVR
jgi:cephalosporin hydroxylase